MPWKNPRCPECGGKTKKEAESLDKEKWYYRCKFCQKLFLHWGHKKRER